jgi:NAD(P)-dependent dehydrogenase (short-subunit alcohol dehydrogenase family)
VVTATEEAHLSSVLSALGDRAEGVALDLRDADSVRKAGAHAIAALGRVDVLILNAGLLGVRTLLADYPMNTWDDVISAGVTGNMRLVQAVLPAMSDGGAIVHVSSGAAGRAGWGAYGIAKAAFDTAMDMLRDELAPRGIRCVAVNPGGIRTRMRAEAYPGEDPATLPHPSSVVEPFIAIAAGADPGPRVEAREWN